ncbi:MAG: OmpA family protein [Muribaculaceae bacterium]
MNKFVALILLMIVAAWPSVAQQAYYRPALTDNWSVGVSAGGIAPLSGDFLANTRGALGVDLAKDITPAFRLGVDALWSINSSRWPGLMPQSTFFDHQYVGLYGAVDLLRLGAADPRFGLAIAAGSGWGHRFATGSTLDSNFFATQAGVLLSMRLSQTLSVELHPHFVWNMTDNKLRQSSAGYSANRAAFMLMVGVRYHFGPGFIPAPLCDPAELVLLNGQINTLRSQVDGLSTDLANSNSRLIMTEQELRDARQRNGVVREVAVDNHLNTVVDVFFYQGSSTVSPDQMPNVERVAMYLRNNPGWRVEITGYASRDGSNATNNRLARFRADAVKKILIDRYHIAPERITATGKGVGSLFEEPSWNRVSVCTLIDR